MNNHPYSATHKYGGTYARDVQIISPALAIVTLWSWTMDCWRKGKHEVDRRHLVPLAVGDPSRRGEPS